tara:strand:+ start:1146 stop:1460 length:315 start_codon:yes stop_codon:yes gene_type:complete
MPIQNKTFTVYTNCTGGKQLWVTGDPLFALQAFRECFDCFPQDKCGVCEDRVADVLYEVQTFVTLNGKPVPADGAKGVDEFGQRREVCFHHEDVDIEVVHQNNE